MKNRESDRTALDRITEALVEDILNTPPEKLLAEVAEDYGDPRALAKEFETVLGRAVQGNRTAAVGSVGSNSWLSALRYFFDPKAPAWREQRWSRRAAWATVVALLLLAVLPPAISYMRTGESGISKVTAIRRGSEVQSSRIALKESRPETTGSTPPSAPTLVLTINSGLLLVLGNDPVTIGALRSALDVRTKGGTLHTRIILRVDETVPYGEVMKVRRRLAEVGYPDVDVRELAKP